MKKNKSEHNTIVSSPTLEAAVNLIVGAAISNGQSEGLPSGNFAGAQAMVKTDHGLFAVKISRTDVASQDAMDEHETVDAAFNFSDLCDKAIQGYMELMRARMETSQNEGSTFFQHSEKELAIYGLGFARALIANNLSPEKAFAIARFTVEHVKKILAPAVMGEVPEQK